MAVFIEYEGDLASINHFQGYVPNFPDGFDWLAICESPDYIDDENPHGVHALWFDHKPLIHKRENWWTEKDGGDCDIAEIPLDVLQSFDSSFLFHKSQFIGDE